MSIWTRFFLAWGFPKCDSCFQEFDYKIKRKQMSQSAIVWKFLKGWGGCDKDKEV